ncbi:MAG TPA: endonuclease III [Caldithrix sp.]|nr:endonuclease III [Caldithrix sp.]
MEVQQKIQIVQEKLFHLFPEAPLALKFSNGFELLIAVILSAQCTDERVNQVTEKLFQKYHEPEDFLKVPKEELEQDIRPTGFYRQKAKSLRACCQTLIEEFGGKIPQDIDKMTRIPGVGRKTAAMVLGNAYGINQGIAVDTHVKRVVERLGLSDKKNVDKIEQDLMQLVPQEKWSWFSNAMILFGRHICQARKPRCPECPFQEWCPSVVK